MFKVVIIEDEKLAAEKLEMLLQKLPYEIEVLACLDSIKLSVDFLSRHQPDLLFLDIHLADGIAFKIFEEIDIEVPIIFTTAFDQYAIEAFKQHSIDYLLKPIQLEDLNRGIEKYNKLTQKGEQPIDYQLLAQTLQTHNKPQQKRFMVYVGSKIKSISTEEVAYFFIEQKHTFLTTYTGENFAINYSLDKLESLVSKEHFFRINRKLIVGINAIDEVHQFSKGKLKVDLNPPTRVEALVPIERVTKFKKWLNT